MDSVNLWNQIMKVTETIKTAIAVAELSSQVALEVAIMQRLI